MNLLSDKIDSEKLFEYHKSNLIYIGEYIKLADQKASILLTINIALIGFLFNYLKTNDLPENVFCKISLPIGVSILIVTAILIISKIIWPRYVSNKDYYMSWSGVAAYDSSTDYSSVLKNTEKEKFLDDMAEQNHAIAKVCEKKYFWLKISSFLFCIGTALSGISWLLDK